MTGTDTDGKPNVVKIDIALIQLGLNSIFVLQGYVAASDVEG